MKKTRYNIKLAQKKGVEIKDDNPDNFIKLLEKTESRQGFYSHDTNYYKKLWGNYQTNNLNGLHQ